MDVLILGEAPGRFAGGLTRTRVSDLAGRPWEEWADWRNLLEDWPGPGRGKGSSWNPGRGKIAASELPLADWPLVFCLGRRVAGAVLPGGAGFPFFRLTQHRGTTVAVIPHTSGIVRFWNEPENVERASTFLRGLLAGLSVSPVGYASSGGTTWDLSTAHCAGAPRAPQRSDATVTTAP